MNDFLPIIYRRVLQVFISVHSHDKLKKLKLILPKDPFLYEDITTVYVTPLVGIPILCKNSIAYKKIADYYNYTRLEYFTQSYTKALGSFTTQNDKVKLIHVSSEDFSSRS